MAVISAVVLDARQPVEPFQRWAFTHVLPLRTVEPGSDIADMQQLAGVIGQARVVALGEPAHGAHEPLAFRNRLFQYLVAEQGFSAIAIESGLPESRAIHDFVNGGPGDVRRIVRANLSYNFGALEENVDLVEWMRAYNVNPEHQHKLRFYGVDLSLGGPRGYTPTRASFDAALTYLAAVDQASAARERSALEPFLNRLPSAASFTTTEHTRLHAATDDLVSLFASHHRTFVARTSEHEYAWGLRNAVVALQSANEFRVALPGPLSGPILPGDWRAAEARDSAMAENVRWVLDQEGLAGRVLVFAHNAHVKTTRTEGGIWNVFAHAPNSMGARLRNGLGDRLLVIGTSAAENPPALPRWTPDPGNLDRALAEIGPPMFVLDLRLSRADGPATAWLAEPRTLRANFTTTLTVSTGRAFDVLFFVRTLSQAHVASPTF